MTDYIIFPGCFAFIAGACIGSFLNVCIYRIPENRSIISPGSFCPHCLNSIPFYLNIPILSYLFLKGRCRFCNRSISIRYLTIEALTGIFAVLLVLRFGITSVAFFWFIFISVLITISFIDMDHQIIPDRISIPGIFIFVSSFYFLPEMTFFQSVAGILAGGGLLYAVAAFYYLLRKQEGMGGGDIKLLAMIGAATGVQGVLFTVFTGSLLGALSGTATLFYMKRSDSKFRIPFGPFLSAGAVLYVFFGDELIQWYTGIIGR